MIILLRKCSHFSYNDAYGLYIQAPRWDKLSLCSESNQNNHNVRNKKIEWVKLKTKKIELLKR
jgi:hypothetical protein